MKRTNLLPIAIGSLGLALASQAALADCKAIDAAAKAANSNGGLQAIANDVVDENNSGGFNLPMWVTIVDETGKICQVLNTTTDANGNGKDANGHSNGSWLGSRIISAQKANTANAFSLDGFSISTANLYGLVQPGGSLYGLQHSNPVDASRAYAGSPNTYGSSGDPLKNKRIGGVNVFGGGLALYNAQSKKIGAIGVSGDTSCTDHAVAWQIRQGLGLDNVPAGFYDLDGSNPNVKGDEIQLVADVTPNTTEHPVCGGPNGDPTVGTYTAP